MWDRFTDRTREVMLLANRESNRLHHPYVGTEHLLLGLLALNDTIGMRVLELLGADRHAIRQEIERRTELGPDFDPSTKADFVPGAKQAIMYTMEEAKAAGRNYVGTEHLLLGLLRVPNGIAAQVLGDVGITLENARQQLRELEG